LYLGDRLHPRGRPTEPAVAIERYRRSIAAGEPVRWADPRALRTLKVLHFPAIPIDGLPPGHHRNNMRFTPIGEGITYVRVECANCLAHTRVKRAEYRATLEHRAPFLCEVCGVWGRIEAPGEAAPEHTLLVGA
jgi:hypothetical protein